MLQQMDAEELKEDMVDATEVMTNLRSNSVTTDSGPEKPDLSSD